MEEGEKALRYFVCSSSRSFCKKVKKSIERIRFGEEIIVIDTFQQIGHLLEAGNILFIDEELIIHGDKSIISEYIDHTKR